MVRKTILFLSLVVAMLSGCERYIESSDPVRSLPEALARPVNVDARLDNQAVILSWEMADSTGISVFRIYATTDTTAGFALVDSSTVFDATVTGLDLNQVYFFKVAAVDEDGVEGLRSVTVSAQVSLFAITINGGNDYTNATSVQVQMTTNGSVSKVYLSEDPALTGALSRIYASQLSFDLSSGDGTKTVYGRFEFFDGSEIGSILSDDIILDTRAAITSVTFEPVGTDFSFGDTITFMVTAGESGGDAIISLTGLSSIRLYDDGVDGDTLADDGVYSFAWVVPNDVTLNNGTVEGTFADAAGNEASAFAGNPLTILNSPQPVQLTLVEVISTYQVSLNWTQTVSTDFANYRLYRDTSPDVSDTTSELISTITNRGVTTYTDSEVEETTTYYYRLYVRNSLGLSAASNVDSVTTIFNDPPIAVVLAGTLQSDSATAELTWTQNDEDDFDSYRVYRASSSSVDNNDVLVDIISSRTQTTTADFSTSAARWYRVYVYDRQGKATGSNAVQIAN